MANDLATLHKTQMRLDEVLTIVHAEIIELSKDLIGHSAPLDTLEPIEKPSHFTGAMQAQQTMTIRMLSQLNEEVKHLRGVLNGSIDPDKKAATTPVAKTAEDEKLEADLAISLTDEQQSLMEKHT